MAGADRRCAPAGGHVAVRADLRVLVDAGNDRRAVVDTIQQLEQRVLFQLMLGAGPEQDVIARQVTAAVTEAQVDLPDPTQAPPPVRRSKPKRRGGPPRSRRRR